MYSVYDEIFCNERRRMEGAVSRYSFVPRYSFSGLMRKREREREKKKSAEMVFPILKYTNRWGRLTRFDALTTGNVAAFIGRVSPASSSSRSLLLAYIHHRPF